MAPQGATGRGVYQRAAERAMLRQVLSRRTASQAGHDNAELGWIDRLWNMHVVPGGERPQPILDPPVRRQRHGGGLATFGEVESTQLLDERVAVLVWHLDVGDQNIGAPVLDNLQALRRRQTLPD